MRLVTFEVSTAVGPFSRVGLWDEDDSVWDVTSCSARQHAVTGASSPLEHAELDAPSSMTSLLALGGDGVERVAEVVDAARSAGDLTWHGRTLRHDLDGVRLLAPVPRPPTVRDFLMVKEHVLNSYKRLPPGERPPYSLEDMRSSPGHWKGNPGSVFGPGDTIPYPSYTDQLDYELELAVVIGRPGRDLTVEQASSSIAGYTLFNDWSARDIQMLEMRSGMGPGLGKDFAFSMGPCIRIAEGFDPTTAALSATVDGEVWSQGTIGDMVRSFPELVSWTSRAQELRPGDIIGGGTIGNGCGLELGRYVGPGSTVVLHADGIGDLVNVVSEKPEHQNPSWP